MINDLKFVPNIILCCDKENFINKVKDIDYNIIATFDITKSHEGLITTVIFNDDEYYVSKFKNLINKYNADYIIFDNIDKYLNYIKIMIKYNFYIPMPITVGYFISMPHDFFYDNDILPWLIKYLSRNNIKTLLDYNGYFDIMKYFVKFKNNLQIDGIIKNKSFPEKNIYNHVYEEIPEKAYDTILVADTTITEFKQIFYYLNTLYNKLIIFTKRNSDLYKYIMRNVNLYKYKETIHLNKSSILILNSYKNQTINIESDIIEEKDLTDKTYNFYILNDKIVNFDPNISDHYKVINIGKTIYNSSNYLKENMGANLNNLNKYLDDLTGIYWVWKNTNDNITGIMHYNRYFTLVNNTLFSYDKILTESEILDILKNYDIIVPKRINDIYTNMEYVEYYCGKEITKLVYDTICKHIPKPYIKEDYLSIFKYVMDSTLIYINDMVITYKDIYDKYCKFLFSFILDVTNEILDQVDLTKEKNSKVIGYFGEMIFTSWLYLQDDLKIKELNILTNFNI